MIGIIGGNGVAATNYHDIVTMGICNAKNSIRLSQNSPEHPSNLFPQVISHLKSKSCDAIVAGCTDIRNVFFPNTLFGGDIF